MRQRFALTNSPTLRKVTDDKSKTGKPKPRKSPRKSPVISKTDLTKTTPAPIQEQPTFAKRQNKKPRLASQSIQQLAEGKERKELEREFEKLTRQYEKVLQKREDLKNECDELEKQLKEAKEERRKQANAKQ